MISLDVIPTVGCRGMAVKTTATYLLILGVLLLGAAVSLAPQGTAQVSEEEAKQIFEQIGCTSCHNNAVAPDWNGVLEILSKAQTEYGGDIDALARDINYFGRKGAFNSWDELMQVMAQNVGKTMDDPDIQKLNEFYLAYMGVAGTQQPEQPAEEQPAEEQPAAETQPTQGEQAPGADREAQAQEAAKGIPFGLALAIAVVITLVIVAVAYFFTRK